MTQAAHTPGPLAVEECPISDSGFKTVVVVPGKLGQPGTVVADCAHNWQEAAHGERRISWKEAEANALLFAGAGELLEACEGLVAATSEYLNTGSDQSGYAAMIYAMREAVAKARAAIAKARNQ